MAFDDSNRHRRRLRKLLLIASAFLVPIALGAQSAPSLSVGNQVPTSAQNPVYGSVPDAKPTPGVLSLNFSEAIERALRHNLAGLLSEYNTIEARGEKWRQLSDLLPNVTADAQEVVQKQSLVALGLRSGGPFGNVPPVIGPFSRISTFGLLLRSASSIGRRFRATGRQWFLRVSRALT